MRRSWKMLPLKMLGNFDVGCLQYLSTVNSHSLGVQKRIQWAFGINVLKLLVRKPDQRRHLGDCIKVNSKGIGCDWIHMAQDRMQWRALLNTIMGIQSSIKGGEFLDQ
jgi:hypothetical protein